MNLSNKVIVVTGGSGLLGNSFMEAIKQAGGIAINADISVNTDISNGCHHCDITSEASIDTMIENILNAYGRIDGWVNNAYPRTTDWGNKPEDVLLESWKKNIDMHLTGYFLCCQKILALMKKQTFGSVINMSSIYGVVGPDFTVYEGTEITNPIGYAAIKGGIVNLSRYLAAYYGQYNCRVNCISPGGILDNQNSIFVDNYNKKVPLKRMGTPADIAPSVIFLLSDGASYITGHNLIVDGGWTAI